MKRNYLLFVLIACIFVSCNDSRVKIKGRIACHPNCKIYLIPITPGQEGRIDSTEIDDNGDFKFTVKLKDDNPVIYNLLLHNKGEIIPLILKNGDNINVNSVGEISRNYIVEGSDDSQLMKDISTLLSDGALALDSLGQILVNTSDPEAKDRLLKEYTKEYYAVKKAHITFIIANSKSVAAIYALQQRLPNDETLFNGDTDIIYYKTVADAIKEVYPTSPYVKSLEKLIENYNNSVELRDRIQAEVDNPSSYPEIELPDMYGEIFKLSDNDGKVLLVDFWSAAATSSTLVNAELKNAYKKYVERGFEVFQVSVDTSESLWVSAIQEQELPWITLCDFKGDASSALLAYNVQSVPSNYLIDQKGDIVARNIYGEELEKKLAELLK